MIETHTIIAASALSATALASMIAVQEVDLLTAAFDALGAALRQAKVR